MRTVEVIVLVILFCVSLGSFVIGYFQFKEKGILFHNAYIFALKAERKKMNKKPYYRQSAVTFFILGVMLLSIVFEMIFRTGWFFYFIIGQSILLIVYVIISTIIILTQKR